MEQTSGKGLTVEITWPRRGGEVALWTDLLLARALRSAVGRDIHPAHQLPGTQSRLVFAEWTTASAARAEIDHVMAVATDGEAKWDLDLVANSRGGLRWSNAFLGFLAGIEADRIEALDALSDRPMVRVATRLGARLGLADHEVELLCVLALVSNDEALHEPIAPCGASSRNDVGDVLGHLIPGARREGLDLIGPKSALRRLRLVRGARLSLADLKSAPIAPILRALIDADSCDRDPLAHFLLPAAASKLGVADYGYLPVGIDLLVSVLRGAHDNRSAGVNLLLHGAPGTGKTQLSRLLAQQVGANAFEVPLADDDGEARSGNSRLESLQLCQQALSQHERPLMIFDEAEDLFPSPAYAWGYLRLSESMKGWINRMLETNPVPTIWISNQVSHLDPAFLRRFDLVVEVPPPPRAVRQRLLDQLIETSQISAPWRAELAEVDDLAPDEIERIAHCSTHLQAYDGPGRERVLRQVFEQARKVTGRKATPDHRPLPRHYRPQFVNADINLVEVADRLAATRSGRLCLYGPPGSGKSAYAQHLSERIGMPLLVRRASDLIDKYIGETEKNLARAFSRAAEEGAVLLIDEADSFLQDRQRAQRSWEVSHVNELLTQMEYFEGVLVMCTNLFDQLDPAALRRFDIKVKLDCLRADQRLAMFEECVDRYAITGNGLQHQLARDRLARLDRLTPGDFQTVVRRRQLVADDSVVGFVEALAAEQAGKRSDACRPIGFVRSD